MNKNNRLRTVISYLFTFFIAFFLFVIVLLTTTRFTIMDTTYFMNTLDDTDYYESTATELNRVIKQNAAPSGFPSEMFDNYVKEEDIREDMMQYEKQKINGEAVTISTVKIEERLQNDIDTYIKDNNISVNPSIQVGIDQFKQTIVEKYSYMTQFPYIDMYGKVMQVFQKVFMIAVPVLLIATAVLLIFIHKMYSSRRLRRRFYAYGLIGAGLLTAALPTVLYATRFFEKVNINPEYMYRLLVTLTKNYLMINIVVGSLLIVAGVILTYVKVKKKQIKKKQGSSRVYPENELFKKLNQETD